MLHENSAYNWSNSWDAKNLVRELTSVWLSKYMEHRDISVWLLVLSINSHSITIKVYVLLDSAQDSARVPPISEFWCEMQVNCGERKSSGREGGRRESKEIDFRSIRINCFFLCRNKQAQMKSIDGSESDLQIQTNQHLYALNFIEHILELFFDSLSHRWKKFTFSSVSLECIFHLEWQAMKCCLFLFS